MTGLRPTTPVLLVDGDPTRFEHALRGAWNRREDLRLPSSPWDLSDRQWVWVGTIENLEQGALVIEALSRGIALVVAITLRGRDHHRLLEDLHTLGAVRTPDDAREAPDIDSVQRALLELLAGGATLTAAAAELHLSRRTANRRLADIRSRFGVDSTAEAIATWSATR